MLSHLVGEEAAGSGCDEAVHGQKARWWLPGPREEAHHVVEAVRTSTHVPFEMKQTKTK